LADSAAKLNARAAPAIRPQVAPELRAVAPQLRSPRAADATAAPRTPTTVTVQSTPVTVTPRPPAAQTTPSLGISPSFNLGKAPPLRVRAPVIAKVDLAENLNMMMSRVSRPANLHVAKAVDLAGNAGASSSGSGNVGNSTPMGGINAGGNTPNGNVGGVGVRMSGFPALKLGNADGGGWKVYSPRGNVKVNDRSLPGGSQVLGEW
jgi:hypothetical protein